MALPESYSVFSQLEVLIDRGLPVLPLWGVDVAGTCKCQDAKSCKSPGKHPHRFAAHGVKSASLDKVIVRQWAKVAGMNWGVRSGCPMTDGRYLVVLDQDPRNGGDETLATIQGLRGELPETVTTDTGGGGNHYLLATSEPIASGSGGPGLDILGAEKYFVVAPSRHASGSLYTWALGAGLDDVPIADAPRWLLEGAESTAPRPPRVGDGTARDTILGEAFAIAGMLGAVYPDGQCAVRCPWHVEHSDGRGDGTDSSTVILPPAGGSKFGGFSCKHGHCASRKWMDVLKALPASAVAEAQRKYPLRPVAVEASEIVAEPGVEIGSAEERSAAAKKRDELKEVRERLAYLPSKGGNGFKIVSDIVNLITVLTYDPRWTGLLKWDQFANVLRWKTDAPPWHADDKPKLQAAVWSDADVTRMNSWLRRNWALQIPNQMITEAVYMVGLRDAENPLRDWLETLVWDGMKRLDTWIPRYLGGLSTPYTALAGSKWIISAVARGYRPGCKADHVLILEGMQGRGKSSALETLCGREYFTDTPFDIGNKDAYMALRGRWIVELAELATMSKAETDKVKAFFSSPSDYYRPPYGREFVDVPRQCVFAGSVNAGQYLKDETGNRRFWPVACGVIDLDGLAVDREQLWAEAIVRFKAGENWWPSFEERSLFEEQQEQREEGDAWDSVIACFLSSERALKIVETNTVLTAADLATLALNIDVGKVDRSCQMRIGSTMSRMKWRRHQVRVEGRRVWGYRPADYNSSR